MPGLRARIFPPYIVVSSKEVKDRTGFSHNMEGERERIPRIASSHGPPYFSFCWTGNHVLAPGTITDAPQAHVPGTVQEVILNPEGSLYVVETLNG
jgi:hypothetical protein